MSKSLHRFWSRESISLLILIVFSAVLLAGCGKAPYDEELSPKLISSEISSFNEGTIDSQHVKAVLYFDKNINITDFFPSVKIAGSRIDKKNMIVSAEDTSVSITMKVEKIRNADIVIALGDSKSKTVPQITDASGKYGVLHQEIKALIPSGVSLTKQPSDNGGSYEVSGIFNIRSIAWIQFIDGGELVTDSLLSGADEKDGAIALHGHEFLDDDEYDVAANLAETLTNHFGDRYEFTVDGKSVIAKSLSDESANLELKIYE